MRARFALLAFALTVPVAASAEPPARAELPPPRAEPPGPIRALPDDRFSAAAQRESEESAARQAEFNRRISERSNRAARSICNGCGPGSGSGRTVTPPGTRRERPEAPLPFDPAQAPLD